MSLTQADLIGEALETEEINRASLLAFYAAEEDRRAADRIAGMRYEIVGPKLTFLSRLEGVPRADKGKGVKGSAAAADTAAAKLESGRRRLIEVIGEAGKAGWRPNMGMGDAPPGAVAASATPPLASTSALISPRSERGSTPTEHDIPAARDLSTAATFPQDTPSDPHRSAEPVAGPTSEITSHPLPSLATSSLPTLSRTSFLPKPSSHDFHPPHPVEAPATDDTINGPHARNYVILSDFQGTRQDEMGAIFGQHHEWGSVKVVPSRSRVLRMLYLPILRADRF